MMAQNRFRYLIPNRLTDIMALLQVLALHPYTRRSEEGLTQFLRGKPASADKWLKLAAAHPEFFRVALEHFEERGEVDQASLVARIATAPGPEGKRSPVDVQFLGVLMETAKNLYDSEWSRANAWQAFTPVLAVIVSLLSVIVGAWLIPHH